MPNSNLYMSFPTEDPSPNGVSPLGVVPQKTSEPQTVNHLNKEHATGVDAGRLPEEVYANTLPRWRAELRQKCIEVVEWESEVIATWQARVRSPWLDAYFIQTSMLGTHTFFLVFLPLFFFFGHFELGRGLCYALAFGVYLTSFLKDMACSPRPYAPPVTRLSVGNHHLEYGFPSTHSANSMSMALFLGTHLHDLHCAGTLSTTTFLTAVAFLFLYVVSIVGGRLYTGMHGFMDVSVGAILGVIGWMLQRLVMPEVERWITHSGWSAPLTVTLVGLLFVNQHPSPVDDCPCFEDAIAFVSVICGIINSFWFSKRVPALNADLFTSVMPGAAFDSPVAITTWVLVALLKIITGILVIFAWRILAKPTVQTLLPPLFRWLAHASPMRLPHRRHYTPATEYSHGPPHTLRAVPSMIDLAMAGVVDEDDGGIASGREGPTAGTTGTFKRRRLSSENVQEKAVAFEVNEGGALDDDDKVKHYDADVLTKVVVYAGIGIISHAIVPAMFEALGWGI